MEYYLKSEFVNKHEDAVEKNYRYLNYVKLLDEVIPYLNVFFLYIKRFLFGMDE